MTDALTIIPPGAKPVMQINRALLNIKRQLRTPYFLSRRRRSVRRDIEELLDKAHQLGVEQAKAQMIANLTAGL
jgi:hypothetical protein